MTSGPCAISTARSIDVIQLAHVARPRVLEQHLHRAALEAGEALAVALRVLTEEVLRQQRRCLRAGRAAAGSGSRSCSAGTADPAGNVRPPTSSFRSALVAEMIRTFTRRVREEPSRSNSPVSITRSSLACWLSGTFAISSRKSVAWSASSKRPTRSALASVKAPRTWPNSSLSNTPSETPPELTITIGRDARLDMACSARATTPLPVPFSPRIEHVGVRRPDPRDHLQHVLHRGRLGDDARHPLAAQQRVLRFEPLPLAQRLAQLDLRPDDGQRAGRCPTASGRSRGRRGASLRPPPRRCPRRS